ncbi:hypothetical protein Tco_0494010 [Tanacetum coccineum]
MEASYNGQAPYRIEDDSDNAYVYYLGFKNALVRKLGLNSRCEASLAKLAKDVSYGLMKDENDASNVKKVRPWNKAHGLRDYMLDYAYECQGLFYALVYKWMQMGQKRNVERVKTGCLATPQSICFRSFSEKMGQSAQKECAEKGVFGTRLWVVLRN